MPIYVSGMADSSIRIYVRAQVERVKYYDAQNQLYIKVKKAFDEAGISIPFPQKAVIRIWTPAEAIIATTAGRSECNTP